MNARTDEHGRLQGLQCHDGRLVAVEVLDGTIEMKFHRLDGTPVRIVLDGVRHFAMDRFLEGNIVDSAYLWPVSSAPKNQRKDASAAFSMDEIGLDRQNDLGADNLFVLESSYGATVHALVRHVLIVAANTDRVVTPT